MAVIKLKIGGKDENKRTNVIVDRIKKEQAEMDAAALQTKAPVNPDQSAPTTRPDNIEQA